MGQSGKRVPEHYEHRGEFDQTLRSWLRRTHGGADATKAVVFRLRLRHRAAPRRERPLDRHEHRAIATLNIELGGGCGQHGLVALVGLAARDEDIAVVWVDVEFHGRRRVGVGLRELSEAATVASAGGGAGGNGEAARKELLRFRQLG